MSTLSRITLQYIVSQFAAKCLAGLSQLYALFVFSKILGPSDAALISLLFGYVIWAQIAEFGLSQVIQNGINNRTFGVKQACTLILIQYLIVLSLALLLLSYPDVTRPLAGGLALNSGFSGLFSFALGIGLILVSTSNVLVQRFLLVIGRGVSSSLLPATQAILGIFSLVALQMYDPPLITCVIAYFSIPVIVNIAVLLKISQKMRIVKFMNVRELVNTLPTFLAQWGLATVTTVYLGLDYYFVAHNLDEVNIIQYNFIARLYFFSFVVYYSYLQFKLKGVSIGTVKRGELNIGRSLKSSIYLGVFAVTSVFLASNFVANLGLFEATGSEILVNNSYTVAACIYYLVRVVRDVLVVFLLNTGFIAFLYAIYLSELILGYLLMDRLSLDYGGVGIFYSMAFSSTLAAVLCSVIIYRVLSSPRKPLN